MPDEALAWQSAWRKVCLNIDGIAIGSTVAALAEHGVLEGLAQSDSPVPIDDLALSSGANRAYLHLALKLLAGQGFIRQERNEAGSTVASLTADGIIWLQLLSAYRQIPALLSAAAFLPAMLRGLRHADSSLLDALNASLIPPSADVPPPLQERVYLHCLGPGVAAGLTTLAADRAFGHNENEFSVTTPAAEVVSRLLAAQGWATDQGKGYRLTEEGRLATRVAGQYKMALSYLPTFREAPRRLFPGNHFAAPENSGLDGHLDRQMDIEFSGEVFSRHCRTPLLEVALPLFCRTPLARQPRLIVDTGCGDGSLLTELFVAIREQTPRGSALEQYPLLAVGADVSPVARNAAATTLAAAGIPHLVLDGDIGRPAELAAQLAEYGIDMCDALHVGKSVIHNRSYRPPQDLRAAQTRGASSEAIFIAPDGSLIDASMMEQNLLEHFRAWLPWTRRHGMLTIEAHTMPSAIAAALVGRSVVAMLDASHGYSHQYPVEAACHRALAREAGFVTLASRDLVTIGRLPLLTLDHLQPPDDAESAQHEA